MKKIIITIFIIICIIVLFVIGYLLLKDYFEYDSNNKDIEELVNEVFIDNPTEEKNKVDWKHLKSINEDIIAWIEIEGTQINYPILKDNGNLYYLKHNYLKKYNRNGSIFTLEKQPFEKDETLLYGHNMRNSTMFSLLGDYLDKDFLFAHQKINIYTPICNYEGIIFSVYSIGIEKEKSNISNLNYEEKIEYYKNSSKIQIKDVNITDKIIKLSTCSYLNSKTSPTDQRYYIIATLNKIN